MLTLKFDPLLTIQLIPLCFGSVLDENLLSGSLPGTELSALLQLKRLSISRKTKAGRRLSGPMPKFDKLTKLEYFLLGGNDLTGSLPEEFLSGSRAIAMVDLSNNNDLTGTLPPGLISMQRSKLSVPEDLMPGYVPMRSRLQTERELLMSIYSSCGGKSWYRNDFWGTNVDICDWYGVGCHNGHIILLNLQNNNLRGTVPPEVFFLSKLQALWLSSNPITVTFSKIRSSLYLRDMKLDNTSLATLSGLGDATGITSIDLSSNVFTDKAFPAEMLRLSNLRILSMSSSGLVGTLPVTLGSVPLLRSLDLSNNLFNGTLPSWSENVALARVLLHDNTLSGAIPSDFLGRVPSLTRLVVSLNNNQMTGYIPYEFQQGTKLNVNRGTASSGVCTVVNRFGLILSLLLSCFAAFGVLFS